MCERERADPREERDDDRAGVRDVLGRERLDGLEDTARGAGEGREGAALDAGGFDGAERTLGVELGGRADRVWGRARGL